MYKQTQTQTNYVIQYSIHIEVVPLNGEEEENEQTKKQREGKQNKNKTKKQITNKQIRIQIKL